MCSTNYQHWVRLPIGHNLCCCGAYTWPGWYYYFPVGTCQHHGVRLLQPCLCCVPCQDPHYPPVSQEKKVPSSTRHIVGNASLSFSYRPSTPEDFRGKEIGSREESQGRCQMTTCRKVKKFPENRHRSITTCKHGGRSHHQRTCDGSCISGVELEAPCDKGNSKGTIIINGTVKVGGCGSLTRRHSSSSSLNFQGV